MKHLAENAMKIRFLAIVMSVALFASACAPSESTVQSHELSSGAVSYLGPSGTYTQEAAKCFFGDDRELLPQKTVADAVDRLIEGESVYAVIPQENTLGGPVYDYVDELLSHDELSIVGEVELPIRQALLTGKETELSDIKVVYSHQQGIIQGKAWLEENIPDAEVIEVSSTAEGARMVSESADSDCAAVASAAAADVYGLKVMAESIQQNEANKTRFYILSTGDACEHSHGRMVFTATGDASSLPELIESIEKNKLELIAVHDRPEKSTLGRYIYLIECENGGRSEFDKISKLEDFEFNYYGSFPVIQP